MILETGYFVVALLDENTNSTLSGPPGGKETSYNRYILILLERKGARKMRELQFNQLGMPIKVSEGEAIRQDGSPSEAAFSEWMKA